MDSSSKNTILIHGYGFDHRTWYPLELAFEGHNVTYLALPGFGLEPVIESYSVAGLAKKYWKHLDELGVENVNLVGHSMGGYVCMEMLALYPSRVSSLALLHSHVFEDSAEKKAARTETANDIKSNGRTGFINKFYSALFADPDSSMDIIRTWRARGLQYDDNAWYYGTLAMRDRADHAETLKTTGIPVLLMMGGKDKAVPVDLGLKQSILAGHTSLHLYESTGHMGMYENTHQVISDLIRFYGDLSA